MHLIRPFIAILVCMLVLVLTSQGQNKYAGVKICGMCHKAEKQGNQLGIWQKSKHSEAYKTLVSAKADSVARAKGLKKPASESPECLECHVVGYKVAADLVDKNFDYKDGVQCETCHGAGSGYKAIPIMKDKVKSAAAGLKLYKNEAEIEKLCRTCHNEKSPMYKGFKFEQMWAKVKHPKPKA